MLHGGIPPRIRGFYVTLTSYSRVALPRQWAFVPLCQLRARYSLITPMFTRQYVIYTQSIRSSAVSLKTGSCISALM
jgi:hypothetical protein